MVSRALAPELSPKLRRAFEIRTINELVLMLGKGIEPRTGISMEICLGMD